MKKIISILLVLTVLVNFVGFGVFNVRASAELVTVLSGILLGLVGGTILGGLSSLAGEAINNNSYKFDSYDQAVIDLINSGAINRGEVVQLVEKRNADGSYTCYFTTASGLSGKEKDFADFLCNSLNSSENLNKLVQGYQELSGSTGGLPASLYSAFKSDVMNSFLDYSYIEGVIQGVDELSETGEFPTYSFDFVGPTPSITIPTSTGYMSTTTADGLYQLSVPAMLVGDNGQVASKNLTTLFGCSAELYGGNDSIGYTYRIEFDKSKGAYGWGRYIVFNGKIYYFSSTNTSGNNIIEDGNYTFQLFTLSSVKRGFFVSAEGEKLIDAMTEKGVSTLSGMQFGVYFVKEPGVPTVPTVSVSESDMIGEVGGGTLEIPRTDAENMIGAASSVGIITNDPIVQLNEEGDIIGADNIDLSTIEDLLRGLQDSNVDLSSVEGYLASIRTLLANGNVKTDDIKQILKSVQNNIKDITALKSAVNSLKALEQSQASSLASIDAQIATITEALTAAQEINADTKFEIDTPDTIIDKFPFSLPFDVYNTFNLLSAEPVAPKFTFPIKMEGMFDYTINVDLSEYEWIAEIVRWLLFVVFVIGLILATNKLIGRG